MDLNSSFRREGLNRFRNLKGASSGSFLGDNSNDFELWSCLLLQESSFTDCLPRAILVGDSHVVPHFSSGDTYLELFEAMQAYLPTLFMAQTPLALDRGALPGERTLFCPRFPSLHRKALASCQCVVSFHLEPVLVALANRVPTVFLSGRKNEETQLAAKLGIPVIVGQDPQKIAAEIEIYLSHYSWKKWDEFYLELRRQFPFLETKSAAPHYEKKTESAPQSPFTVCSITDSGYLPFILGFLENVNQASAGHFRCFLLALDSQVSKQVKKLKIAEQVEILEMKDLWSKDQLPTLEARSIGFRAFSTKPKLIEAALRKTKGPVFYCDSDVYFFEPVTSLQKVMGRDSIVLFPHFNDEYPCAQLDGLFNAGMIAVAPGAEGFLEWWGELCYLECEFNRSRAAVGDQAYLNQVPILFDHVQIYKGHNHNVARWNSKTFKLTLNSNGEDIPTVENGLLVSTYHAALCDEQGVYEKKFCWDQLVSFFSPAYVRASSKTLISNLRFQQKSHWAYLEHLTKLESLFQKWPLLNRTWNPNVNSSFWFKRKVRRGVSVILFFRRALRQIERLGGAVFRLHNPTLPSHAAKISSERWVETNLKALKSSRFSA